MSTGDYERIFAFFLLFWFAAQSVARYKCLHSTGKVYNSIQVQGQIVEFSWRASCIAVVPSISHIFLFLCVLSEPFASIIIVPFLFAFCLRCSAFFFLAQLIILIPISKRLLHRVTDQTNYWIESKHIERCISADGKVCRQILFSKSLHHIFFLFIWKMARGNGRGAPHTCGLVLASPLHPFHKRSNNNNVTKHRKPEMVN